MQFSSWFKKFLRTSGAGIGLDIGSHSVQVVRLHLKKGETPLLEHVSIHPIPAGSDAAAQSQVIRRALERVDVRQAPLVTAVGGSGTVVRLAVLPKMTPQELRSAVSFETEKYIPFKPEDVYFDVAVLGESGNGQADVLVAAARKDLVDEHLQLLAQAGVSPAAVDLETLALVNALEKDPARVSTGVTAHAHINANGTFLNILQNGRLRFVREFPLALQLDAPETERIKWLDECKRSFDFYENQHGQPVERLLLSGGAVISDDFCAWLHGAAGLAVERWDPLQGLKGEVPAGFERGVLAVAVGLALRGASG